MGIYGMKLNKIIKKERIKNTLAPSPPLLLSSGPIKSLALLLAPHIFPQAQNRKLLGAPLPCFHPN